MSTSQLPAATRLRRELTDPDGDWQCQLLHSDHAQAGVRIHPDRRNELLELAERHGVTMTGIDRWTTRTPGFVLEITSTHLPKTDISAAIATVLLDWDRKLRHGHTPAGAAHTKAAALPSLGELATMESLRGYTARKILTPLTYEAEDLLMARGHQAHAGAYGTSVPVNDATTETLTSLLSDHITDIDLTDLRTDIALTNRIEDHVLTALHGIELLDAAIALSTSPPDRKITRTGNTTSTDRQPGWN